MKYSEMNNTEIREITYEECPLKCTSCSSLCDEMPVGQCRKNLSEKFDKLLEIHGVLGLTDEEIDCFNSYIEDAKMNIAFGNTDWCSIYHKIVGNRVSDYAKAKMDLYNSQTENI